MEILIVTNNSRKLSELRKIIGNLEKSAKLYTLSDVGFTSDIPETADTFEGNAMQKAQAPANLGMITVADDSGLCVDALDGAPGVFSARYGGEGTNDLKNNEKLLRELEGKPYDERRAKFVSSIACRFPDGRSFTVRGECPGVILTSPRGNGGFGYDPLFLYEPLGKTFSELSADEKNEISHRAVALRKFAVEFEKYIKG